MNTGNIYRVFHAESSGSICVPFRCVKPEKYAVLPFLKQGNSLFFPFFDPNFLQEIAKIPSNFLQKVLMQRCSHLRIQTTVF